MPELIVGTALNIGLREVYEDLGEVHRKITTKGGLALTCAIVADGVGGSENGETAARQAVDAFVKSLQTSTEAEIISVLIDAVKAANTAVYAEVSKRRDSGKLQPDQHMATTLVAAMVYHTKNESRLYIANVGDSRLYLVRGRKLTQLTIDHTYKNVRYWPDELSEEEQQRNIPAEALMRAIGVYETVKVDIGFYVGDSDPELAESRGLEGLPLKPGDSVLLCSDGLTKLSDRFNSPYCTEEEIVNTLRTMEGAAAASILVSYATGRMADDNVTVSLIQMPDPKRRRREFIRQYRWAGVAILLLLTATLGLLAVAQNNANVAVNAEQTAARVTLVAQETQGGLTSIAVMNTNNAVSTNSAGTAAAANAGIVAVTQTALAVAAYTSTPTSTPLPPGAAGNTANGLSISKGGSFTSLVAGAYLQFTAPNSPEGEIAPTFGSADNFTRAYLFGSGAVLFNDIFLQRLLLEIARGGSTFVVLPKGGYSGAEIRLQDTGVTAFLEPPIDGQPATCMSVDTVSYAPLIALGCYGGECNFRLSTNSEMQSVSLGQYAVFEPISNASIETFSVVSRDNQAALVQYRQALRNSPQPRNSDYGLCLARFDPRPTAVPTLTPTMEPLPTQPPTPPLPTNAPPTERPRPTAPPPTITAEPPTDQPPSNTPMPTIEVPPTNPPTIELLLTPEPPIDEPPSQKFY